MGNPFFNKVNGHYYELISANVIWTQALDDSAAKTYSGLGGYLATISNSTEMSFIRTNVPSTPTGTVVWIGISDSETEGLWKFMSGPEKGTNATFFNWFQGEPNNQNNEDYVFYFWGDYSWNDSNIGSNNTNYSKSYLVEYGGLPESYSISPSTSSVNEGTSVTFSVNTKNVEWGSTISYSISGISTGDVSGGVLSGNVVVNSSGVATILVTLLNDNLTEGSETLTVTAGGATVSTVINDTSKSSISPTNMADPIYSDYTKHYYQALTNNVSWYSALSLASAQSYRGLQGYLVTITSKTEDDFVNNSVVKPSAITGYGFSSDYKSFWIGASDEYVEGTWVWISGPESGQTLYKYGGNNNTSYENFYLPVYSLGSADADYLFSQVPVENATLFPGNINRIFWDDIWNNPIMSGQSGNGFVVEYGGLPATYSITPSSTSVDEGSTLIFTVNTTNIEWGTSINYSISGISSADISDGKLSGTTTIFQNGLNGLATVVINIAADKLTEGNETLILNVGSATASAVINDTSPTPSVFIQQVNVENANTYWSYWYVNPTNWSNWGSPRITLTSELTGNTPLKITAAGSINTDPYVHTDDGQLHPGITNAAGIYLAGSANGYNPGTTTRVPLNLPNGTLLNAFASWGALLIGNPEIGWTSVFNANSDNGLGSTNPPTNLSISTSLNTLIGRALPSGTVLFLTYNDQDNSNTGSYTVSLLDTTNNSTLSLVSSSASVNEGSAATFTLTTTNLTSGTSVPYTLSGVSAADVSSGSLSGNAVVNSSGVAIILVTLLSDTLTEGAETLQVTAGGASASTVVNDTSTNSNFESESNDSRSVADPATLGSAMTGQLSAATDVDYYSYTVGGAGALSITFDGPTNSVSDIFTVQLYDSAETKLSSWTTGVDTTWSAGVSAAGTYYVGILATENYSFGSQSGQYALTSTFKGTSQSTYSITALSSSVNEGSAATFTLTTTNVASGTSIPYTLSGISAADLSGDPLSANTAVNSSGVATISVRLLNDALTEGAETITVTAGGSTASIVVNDTSTGTETYSLSASSASVDEGAIATFDLLTTSVAAGTSISYSIGGVSTEDITGGLTGTATVGTNGIATIFVAVAADFLTDDGETLTVTAHGKSATMTINDTSKAVERATAASDVINDSPTSQNIDGGAGIDTLLYTSTSYDVLISKSGASTVVTNTSTGEVDTLINVERLKFADTAIALDTSGVGGQVYRIYQAAFNRAPDVGGLGYWISGMDGGASLKSVAQGFVSSAEFKALYGASPTNAQIITKLYENVLHRAPDSGGYNYWLGILNSGQGTVADVLAAFSESPENVSGVSGAISSGIRYTPYVSPTYSMFANATSVNEGGVATITLRTTNVAAGSSIPYTLSGVSAADVSSGSLSGNAVVNFSESTENQAGVIGVIQNGIELLN